MSYNLAPAGEQLRPYQRDGARFIVGRRGSMLLHDMGTGKTWTTLHALGQLKLTGELRLAVVIAPVHVAVTEATWQKEALRRSIPLKFSLVHGTPKKRQKAAELPADVYVTTWDSVHTDEVQALLARADTVVLDELSYAKGWSRRVKSLKRHCAGWRRVVELSGTPAPNGLEDLFYPVQLADNGERFGTNKQTFTNRHFYPENPMSQHPKMLPRDEDDLFKRLEGLVHRASNDDLPDVLPNRVPVPMTPDQLEAYRELERTFLLEVASGTVVAANEAVLANKLRQVAAGFVINEGEIDWFTKSRIDMVETLKAEINAPILCTYEYKAQRDEMLRRGAVPLERDGAIERWNAGEIDWLVLHPKSGGHGLNLQFGGNHVIWPSLTWSWELWAQLNARLARPGQKSDTVLAHVLYAPESRVERRVYDVLCEKGATELRFMEWAQSVTLV